MAEPEIKLYYFNVRGRVEFIRMLLVAGGVDFEDIRIEIKDWGPDSAARKDSPYGQLPYMIYKGKKYGQSVAIANFFARKLGFCGKTDEDGLRQEELMHLVDDMRVPNIRDWFWEKDPDKKAEMEQRFRETLFPRYLTYYEAMLADNGGTGFVVGDSVSLADMYLYDILDTCLSIDPEVLGPFPLQQKLRSNVEAVPALKTYLDKRPKSIV